MLEIKNLKVALLEKTIKERLLVKDVSLKIENATIAALVGESGSGKSLTAYSILNLMPSDNLKIVKGEIVFNEENLLTLSEDKLREIRGAQIFMIPQDPLTALNPVLSIEEQLSEMFRYHTTLKPKEIKVKCLELIEKVRIDNPMARLKSYPHQLSGGQRQRVLIAMSIALNPSLVIADEPTTALDVSLQGEILKLFLTIKNEMKKSIFLITHDFGSVKLIADYIYVMYGGMIVEEGEKNEILNNPLHPYTQGLLKSLPTLNSTPKTPLPMIKGYALTSSYFCPFYERCDKAHEECRKSFSRTQITQTHAVLCRRIPS